MVSASKTKRLWYLVAALLGLLVASNAWWFYQALDTAVTASYQDQTLVENQEAVTQLLALVNSTGVGADRQRVLAALQPVSGFEPFEKEGFVIVGRLSLRFDSENRLARVFGPGVPDDTLSHGAQ